ncbi:MAG: LysM peptidoglycan-binding domain-containing protein [Bacteroidales bacterium]|nr:LysM peptidoglycan-binding domain-containing protein [Bacteroidales bacterium]
MTIRIKTLVLTSIIFTLFALQGCSIFRSSRTSSETVAKDETREKNRFFRHNKDLESQSNLFSEEDFIQYESYNPDEPETDTTYLPESFDFDDTVAMFSKYRMNDSRIAEELVNESRSLYMLDNLVNLKFFNDNELLFNRDTLNVFNYAEDYVPIFSDSVYAARIEKLNRTTPLELTYNKTVKSFIELYTVRKRGLTSRILGLAEVYFPMFEEILDQYNMPLELKYLAVVESALIPTAGSHAGAKGLWQFMYRTGKMYGLESNSYVDDRFDPYKSTIAACQHMQDLYDIYQDWWLVLAAYNSGGGNVNKAIRRAGGVKNYWAIWPYLPAETRGYVPAFISVAYLMNYAADHNLYPVHPGILYNAIDTVHVHDVLSFDQISEILSISPQDLQYLNPSFKEGLIPASPDNKYVLRLPRSLTGYFVSKEQEIYSHKTQQGLDKEKLLAQVEEMQKREVHVVKSGESLGSIARKYKTSVSSLQSWNNLRSTTIHPGQKLLVQPNTSGKNVTTAASGSGKSGEQTTHTVRSGENLGSIAAKYRCSVSNLKQWNNLKSNTIYPKQKLIVYSNAATTLASSGNAQKSSVADTEFIYYVVKPGDTLWDIAKKYNGVTVEDLKRLNNIKNAQSLKVGQKIKVSITG